MKAIFDLIGRICLSTIFYYEAYDSIRFFGMTKDTMTQYGITWRQDLLLVSAIGALIFGATLILIGYRSGLGAVLLLFYWVPITFIVYDFWNYPAEEQRFKSFIFFRNIAVVGGLLAIYANGVGKYSIKRLFATYRVPRA